MPPLNLYLLHSTKKVIIPLNSLVKKKENSISCDEMKRYNHFYLSPFLRNKPFKLVVASIKTMYNCKYLKGANEMKQIQLNSPEFNRVLKNLQLEDLTLTPALQQKVIDIVNSGIEISPSVIKEALENDKIQ